MSPTDRQRRTRQALVSGARRLTAQHGLAGFTVEQLCDEAGVSRRTFFNYFPTKESAVLGVDPEWDAAFLERYRSIPAGERISPLDDLASLAVDAFAELGPTREEARAMIDAVRREPRILAAVIEQDREQELRIAAVIEQRDGLDPLTARMTAVLSGSILRAAAHRVFAEESDLQTFPNRLQEHLDAARAAVAHRSPAAGAATTPIRTKDA